MGWDISTGPGVTALGLAAARSVESGRPDGLIEDPFARALFTAAGADLPMRLDWPGPGETVSDTEKLHLHGSRYIGVRTRFYDDLLLDAAAGGVRQVVALGAGLDTRAHRLALPAELRLFEVEQEAVLAYKRRVLDELGAHPRCDHVAVGADLRADWTAALQTAGFDPTVPTAWTAEGLLAYLDADAQAVLLASLAGRSAPGSVVGFDRIAGTAETRTQLRDLSERSGIDMDALVPDAADRDLTAQLRDSGWTVQELPAARLADGYGRDLADPFSAPEDGTPPPPWLPTVFATVRRT